jgi:NAD dependent epimerase/dehydratase
MYTWNRKRVLVTGAGGFIGSHLTETLVAKGAEVRAFVRYNSRNDRGWLEELPTDCCEKIEIVMGDLRDAQTMHDVMKHIEIVFHLAALIPIPYSYVRPQESVETNILGTLNVLNAARDHDVLRFVHTSTSEVYGTAQYIPIDEKHPLQGQSPYSASKIGADKIAESFFRSYGLPVAIIRPFNTYGPRQSARAVIPTIISQALSKNNIHLGSLNPTRDLTYVSDTVEGFIRMAESDNAVGEVVNIGSNFEISIGDLAKKIIKIIGSDIRIVGDKERIRPAESEVERLFADNSKARKLIGWKPSVSLEEGLDFTIKWVENNLSRFKVNIYNI